MDCREKPRRYGSGALPRPHHHSQGLPGWLTAKLHCLVCHVTATAAFSTAQCNCWHNSYKHTESNQQLGRKAMLTKAMNGSTICSSLGSSVAWSSPSTSLITKNNPEMAGCFSLDSYVLRIKSNNRSSLSSWWSQHLFFFPQLGARTRVLSSKSFLTSSPDSPASSTTTRMKRRRTFLKGQKSTK